MLIAHAELNYSNYIQINNTVVNKNFKYVQEKAHCPSYSQGMSERDWAD